MTYSLTVAIQYITCPVVLVTDTQEIRFDNGREAVERKFDKYYLIDEVFARKDEIVVHLKANDKINATNWCGEEQVSFF